MSWLYMPEESVVYLRRVGSFAGKRFVMSNTPVTPSRLSKLAFGTACWTGLRSGMTPTHSTGNPGVDAWILSLPDSLVSPSAQLETYSANSTPATDGPPPSELFVRFDPDTCSWRTLQISLLSGTSEQFSETWPKAGTYTHGMCYRLPGLERRISAKGYGLWPTPTATDDSDRQPGTPHLTKNGTIRHVNPEGKQSFMRLSQVVKLWPTPRANDSEKRGNLANDRRNGLPAAVKYWPTPTATDHKHYDNQRGNLTLSGAVRLFPTPSASNGTGIGVRGDGGMNLQTAIGGALNPEWVEWLMGWPIGWTGLEPLETGKFQEWQQRHGLCCQNDWEYRKGGL